MEKVKRLLLIFLGVFFAFLFLELGLRVFSPARTTIKWRDDSVVGRRLVASQKGWFVTESKEYSTWIEVNSEGWRDSEHSIEKAEGVFRILIIGDSFVENFQVPLEKTFFKRIENTLENTEVIALGLGDSGTAQQYLVLKNFGLQYKPDLVLHLFFTGNDVKNNSLTLMSDPHRPYFKLVNGNLELQPFVTRTSIPKFKIASALKNNIRALELLLDTKGKLLTKRIAKDDYPVDYHVYDKEYSPEYQKAWQVTKTLIKQTENLAKENGADYILFVHPAIEQLYGHPALARAPVDFEKPDKILAEFCGQEEISCLFMPRNPQLNTHYQFDGHWTEEGTNFVAEFLTKELKQVISQ